MFVLTLWGCAQVDLLEVPASLGDRVRVFWAPYAPGHGQHHRSPEDDKAAVLLGSCRVQLAHLVVVANKSAQAIWELKTEAVEASVGQVCIESSWLPVA